MRNNLKRFSIKAVKASVGTALNVAWPAWSRLFFLTDMPNWTLSGEVREVSAIAQRLGIRLGHPYLARFSRRQAIFNASHFFLCDDRWLDWPNRVATAYMHGRPGTGVMEFDQCYAGLVRNHERLGRVQVTHAQMRDVVLSSGIAPEKVFLIPIGINLSFFQMQTPESKRAARDKYGLPQQAVVIGSFQKDGVGWGDGMEPKLVKGPDVFLEAIRILKDRVRDLWVFLSGPARGYVAAGLDRMGVPWRRHYAPNYPAVGEMFQALDLCLVASRQEGGPKAVFEAMASAVPLVTTRVGQAMDVVVHGENGWMAEVEDAEGLAHWAEYALTHRNGIDSLLAKGRALAEANAYERQASLWRRFFDGFVAMKAPDQQP